MLDDEDSLFESSTETGDAAIEVREESNSDEEEQNSADDVPKDSFEFAATAFVKTEEKIANWDYNDSLFCDSEKMEQGKRHIKAYVDKAKKLPEGLLVGDNFTDIVQVENFLKDSTVREGLEFMANSAIALVDLYGLHGGDIFVGNREKGVQKSMQQVMSK